MDQIFWGNILANGLMISIVAWFIKKWMSETSLAVKETAKDLAIVTLKHTEDLDAMAKNNREDVKLNVSMLISSINALELQVRNANGRTSKLETRIEVQRALCQERQTYGYERKGNKPRESNSMPTT